MKLGRCIGIKVMCLFCGKEIEVPQSRLKYGFGKFCSRKCSSHWQSKQTGGVHTIGKENARKHFEKKTQKWMVHWVDETGKQYNTTWARWTWEQIKGPIPEGYIVCYKDEDKTSLDPDNLELRLKSEETAKLGYIYGGQKMSPEVIQKMSDAKKTAYLGEGNPQYIDGRSYFPYPEEFYAVRESILKRDKHTCQSCGVRKYKTLHIHHIDLNKENNGDSNLITLCPNCHSKLHGGKDLEGFLLELKNRQGASNLAPCLL